MHPSRRSFIRQTATLLGAMALHRHPAAAFPVADLPENTPEEAFWRQVRQAYAASPTIINLNNGGVCPTPRATLDALDYYNRMCAEAPSYYMWRILDQDREPLRENLAAFAGVPPDEIAINRNTTEVRRALSFIGTHGLTRMSRVKKCTCGTARRRRRHLKVGASRRLRVGPR